MAERKKNTNGSRKVTRESCKNKLGKSFRLPLTWQKNKKSPLYIFAYNALKNQPNLKARYIARSVLHYKNAKGSFAEKQILFTFRTIECVQLEYDLKTVKDVKNFFETVDVEKIRSSIKPIAEPLSMMCGFTEDDAQLTDVYWLLMEMDVNDRLEYLSQAIFYFVADGNDYMLARFFAMHQILDFIDRYRTGNVEEKIAVVEMFVKLGDFPETVKSVKALFEEESASVKKLPKYLLDKESLLVVEEDAACHIR